MLLNILKKDNIKRLGSRIKYNYARIIFNEIFFVNVQLMISSV